MVEFFKDVPISTWHKTKIVLIRDLHAAAPHALCNKIVTDEFRILASKTTVVV
jgi:hypothetical protein